MPERFRSGIIRFFRPPVTARRTVVLMGLLLALPIAFSVTQARAAASPAEQFVAQNVQKGFNILSDNTLSAAAKHQQFRTFLLSITDIRRIALFTLGPARRTASAQQQDEFVNAFRDFAVAVYQSRLALFSGQTLKVTGSTERRPGDYIVNTRMVDPHQNTGEQPLRIDFRVSKDHGKFVVIDVSIAGIWLAIEERDQFTSFLNEHNNSLPALIAHIRQLTQQLHHGGQVPHGNGG
jgi:phospholipid transport system substrate-binding protein